MARQSRRSRNSLRVMCEICCLRANLFIFIPLHAVSMIPSKPRQMSTPEAELDANICVISKTLKFSICFKIENSFFLLYIIV